LIQQQNYTTMTNLQLGYTLSGAIAGNRELTNNTYFELAQISVPTQGVWLFTGMCSIKSTGGEGTVDSKYVLLSNNTGDSTVGAGAFYSAFDDDISGDSDPRDIINISTIFLSPGVMTLYFLTKYDTSGLTMYTSQNNPGAWRITRIG
jgi:hypothetical protein